jgi:predicted membrane protein
LKLILKKKEKTIHIFDELSGKVVEEVRREDTIDLIAAFAGNKKIIVSKNFKGGSLVSVFGGNEINLSNADIQGTITLEVVQVFGGTKLIVPSNWLIKSEVTSVFGALEDKRANLNSNTEDKVLILEGTSVFASIDIRSF